MWIDLTARSTAARCRQSLFTFTFIFIFVVEVTFTIILIFLSC